jgi:hypothetical protein
VSAFEDELRRAMAGHDDEAPRAEDLLRSLERATPPRRRLAGWYAPFAVAAVVVAVVAGSLWGVRLLGSQAVPAAGPRTAVQAAALACPARYARQAPWVPAKPAGVDGRSRLVPQQTPSSALICAYAGSNMAKQQAGWALSGRRSLTGNLAGLAAQLTWKPRRLPGQQIVCTDIGGPQTNYLIGLTYPGGTIWVAATAEPNQCVAASNGEFTSTGTIGPEVSKAFASGRWPARQAVACDKAFQDIGRLGEDKAMVPAGPTSLTICAPKARKTITSGFQALVQALNQLPTRTSTRSCSGSAGPEAFYQLLFSYAAGPPVSVNIAVGCHPEIDNLDLQSASASSVLPVIQQLLRAK